MKKLYSRKTVIKVNGTRIYTHVGTLHYDTNGEPQTFQLNTFDEAIAALPLIRQYGFYSYLKEHLFKPREEILKFYWLGVNFTRKTFKPITIEIDYLEEEDSNYTMKKLTEELPANEFIEYLKDKGVEKIWQYHSQF